MRRTFLVNSVFSHYQITNPLKIVIQKEVGLKEKHPILVTLTWTICTKQRRFPKKRHYTRNWLIFIRQNSKRKKMPNSEHMTFKKTMKLKWSRLLLKPEKCKQSKKWERFLSRLLWFSENKWKITIKLCEMKSIQMRDGKRELQKK